MGIKVLPRWTRKRRQQPERIVLTTDIPSSTSPPSPSSPSSPSTPAEPAEPATPTSPVLTATTSDDGYSLKRRTSTFRTLERRFSNLSLRSSFSRIRRSRSPPPPYSLEEPAAAPTVALATASAVVVQSVDTQEHAAPTVVAVSTSTPGYTVEDADAIAVVKETAGPSQDSKTVAKVDITTASDINASNTQHGSSNTATDLKGDLKNNQRAEDAAEELLLDVAAAPLEDLPLPSPREAAKFRRLAQPVVVPRLNGGVTVPFARGYAPCLGDTHGIDAATFLAFIDGLNLVTSPHPAAMALSAVAFSMQFVPHDYANAVGGVAQLLAEVTTAVVAHKRGKMFLARANATLFEPRGLHVSIAKTKRMRTVLGIAPKAPLLAPLTEETVELATLERCMHHLNDNGWAASLELEARTGTLMPMAKPTYREASTDVTATWHPDYDAEKKTSPKVAEEGDGDDWDRPPALRRASSTWTTVGRTVSHGLAVVADKRVRMEIKAAEKEASRARRRALKRHHKGKKLKEPFAEKYRVGHLSWILIRNLDDVRREEAEAEAVKAAKKAPKKAPRKTAKAKATGPLRRPRIEVV